MNKLEICCGSYEDVIAAAKGGADRVELNSALHLGGLTPTCSVLRKAKTDTNIQIICMVRDRGAGFCYNENEFNLMIESAKDLLEAGADGIAFGFLNSDRTIDEMKTKAMVELIHSYQKEAVFHRAFDCVKNMRESINTLISLHVDRILTSGLATNVSEGLNHLHTLVSEYGTQIEVLAGCGVNASNVGDLLEAGITQVHSSAKSWREDPTTIGDVVSYAYNNQKPTCYEYVDLKKVQELSTILHQKK